MRSLLTALVALALLAPPALAHDGGVGLYGQTNDKIVTNAGFMLIIFFPLLIVILSLAQGRLDKPQGSPQGRAQGPGVERRAARRLVARRR